jgi:hypothetical protein
MPLRTAETDVLIVAGQLPAVIAQSDKPIPWEVELWPLGGQFLSPTQYTPANYAAAMAVVTVDDSINQAGLLGTNVYSGRNWLTLGPRGTRLQAFGETVSIQLSSTSDAPAVIATSPALRVRVRVAPAGPPRHPDNQRVLQLARGTLNGLAGALQLPMFSTEYRLYGGTSPLNGYWLTDQSAPGGVPNILVDPYTLVAQVGQVLDAADWTPLHPLAAGIYLTSGTILETR